MITNRQEAAQAILEKVSLDASAEINAIKKGYGAVKNYLGEYGKTVGRAFTNEKRSTSTAGAVKDIKNMGLMNYMYGSGTPTKFGTKKENVVKALTHPITVGALSLGAGAGGVAGYKAMTKKSSDILNEVYEQAFADELNKIAVKLDLTKAKQIAESILGGAKKHITGAYKATAGGVTGAYKTVHEKALKPTGAALKKTFTNPSVLTGIGAAAVGAGGTAMATHKKD